MDWKEEVEVIDEFRKVIIIYRRYFNIMYVYPPSVELYFKQVPQEGYARAAFNYSTSSSDKSLAPGCRPGTGTHLIGGDIEVAPASVLVKW